MDIIKQIINFLKDANSIEQIKNSFDKKTLIKIGKGALIAGTGAAALYILDSISTIKFTNPGVAAIVAFAVPFLVNVIKEYLAGKK